MAQVGNEAYGPYRACVGSSFTNSEGGSEGFSFVRLGLQVLSKRPWTIRTFKKHPKIVKFMSQGQVLRHVEPSNGLSCVDHSALRVEG